MQRWNPGMWGCQCVTSTVAIALGLSMSVQSAAAQSAQDESSALPEVLVTAERQVTSLQKTSVAVTAISGQELQDRELHDPSQLRFLASSLQANPVSQSPSNADFSIRGVGTTSFSNSIEYNVSTVLDDVVLARPELGVVQYFDVDDIEILRGPQVTLYGKNASSGVVSIRTRRPKVGVFEGEIAAEASHTETTGSGLGGRLEAVMNIPTTAESALRIDAFGIDQSPYVKNVFPNAQSHLGLEEGGLKAKYLWQPLENLQVYFIGDWARELGAGQHAFTLRSVGNGVPYPAVLSAALAASQIVPGRDNLTLNANAPYETVYATGGAELELDYQFETGYSLTNIVAWREAQMNNIGDTDLTSVSYFDAVGLDLHDEQLSEEVRLASPHGGLVEGLGGLYVLHGTFVRNTTASGMFGRTVPRGLVFRGGESDSTQHADSIAPFGQVTLHATPDLRFIAGARYTYDDIALTTNSTLGNALTPFFPLGSLRQTRVHANFSYKLGAQYDLSPGVTSYVTYTRGYKGPAFNNTASAAAALQVNPEIPVSWELGVKSNLFDRRLMLNLAAFTTTFHDFQTNSVDPATLLTVLQNAGSARTRGVEVEFTARPGKRITMTGGGAYIEATYLSFPNSPCYAGQTVAQGCRVVRSGVTAYDASGQPLGNAPKITANLSVRYDMPLSHDLDGFASVSTYFRTKANFSNNGTPYTWVGAYATVDIDLGIASASIGSKVKLFVHNLLDRRFPGIVQANSAASGAFHQGFSPNSFRVIGTQITYDF